MAKLWQSTSTSLHPLVEKYTVGNDYELDKRLLPFDIQASTAHAQALVKLKILTPAEFAKLKKVLDEIRNLHKLGKFEIKQSDEDCHTAIENYLVGKLGQLGKKIHTCRSRNDQVLVATRLYTRDKLKQISAELIKTQKVFLTLAKKYEFLPMPGYTHTRRAMPSSVGHWAAAYVEELLNDHMLLESAYKLNDQNPMGAAAGFGINLALDRNLTTKLLGFQRLQVNSLYAVSSRGPTESYVLSVLTKVMTTLGRLATDMIWFTTPEFSLFELPNGFTTGSSIMPQKKNPDVFEILRGNMNVVAALQTQIMNISKGLISSYHRDGQLTKEPLMKGLDIVRDSLEIVALVMAAVKPNKEKLMKSLEPEFFAVHEANRLVKNGMPFRDAYTHVKEHLSELKVGDPVKAIKDVVSIGGPGNLQLKNYKISKPL